MAYEYKRDTSPWAYTFEGIPMVRVPEGMTNEEKILWANGITSPEQAKGINSYYEMVNGQETNYSYIPTTRDERSIPVPGRRRKK